MVVQEGNLANREISLDKESSAAESRNGREGRNSVGRSPSSKGRVLSVLLCKVNTKTGKYLHKIFNGEVPGVLQKPGLHILYPKLRKAKQ